MAIWHVYTDGTRADIPFNTVEDKVFGWNSVAVCAEIAGVRVWVVTVNDTHFHSLVCGDEERAGRYRTVLQQRLQRRFPEDNIYVAQDEVESREEIMRKFMYVYRNCLDFYKNLPGEYPWGSGHVFFSEKRHFYVGKRIGDLSVREYNRMFKTHVRLPDHWLYDGDGRILPESFIDYEAVERHFGSVKAFIAFQYVRKEDEAAMKQQVNRRYMESRTIQDLRRIGNRYCSDLCRLTLKNAPFEIRLKVAVKMIGKGVSGRSASLAKALCLRPEDLDLLV